MNKAKLVWALGIVALGLAGCDSRGGSSGKTGGAGGAGGTTNAGGATSVGGTSGTGGISAGGVATGGTSSTGGHALAGTTSVGGTVSAGGIVTGGTTVAGGASGGTAVATGGATGGSRADAGVDAPIDSPDAGRDVSATRDGASDTSVKLDAAPDVPSDSATDGGAGSGLWSMGYYAGYDSTSYPVSAIEWAGMTHIAVAFYFPTATGAFDESLSQGSAAQGATLGHAIVTAAHAHGVKAVASLGGADSRTQFLAATASGVRGTFVGSIVKLAADYGYDGIDFDWESLETADEPVLLDLMQKVRQRAPGLLLTIPVGVINVNMPGDLSGYVALSAAADQINIMSYGAAGAWEGWKSWHSSALYQQDNATPMSVDSSVKAYVGAGVPKAKLGIGIGFYGLCYTPPVTAPDQALNGSTVAASDGDISYANIMTSYYSPAAAKWDGFARVPYLSFAAATGPKGCGYISYDDDRSIGEKGAYLKAQGLGGVIMWEINEGYISTAPVGQRNPLLTSIGQHVLQ
jgi:chitinase